MPRTGINTDPVDRFTAGHAAVGVIMGLARVPWWAAIGIAIGWELVETPLKRAVPRAFPHASPDSATNATFDALAMIAGWAAIKALPKA